MNDLTIVIPARNEMFLKRTIEDALENIEADTDIVAVLDGKWAEPRLEQHDRVNVIYYNKVIGQRGATNAGVRLSKAKYVMKMDAHCSFDRGFDRKMIEFMEEVGDDVTAVPIMRNLWAFDWKCVKCGMKWYQGPTPTECREGDFRGTGKPCDSKKFIRKMMWVGKHNPQSTSYCFTPEPKFRYFEAWKHREPYRTDKKEKRYTETMSLQGSCFMATRENYWERELCDDRLGNWGNQGIEVALKTWLSGGRVLCNHKTWYAHMFRTQGGDFGFPWENSGNETSRTKKRVKNLFWKKQWKKQTKPLTWLLKKFMPIPNWTEEDIRRLE